jgi:hypothetical protein
LPGAYAAVCIAIAFLNGAQKKGGFEIVMSSGEVMHFNITVQLN